MGLFLAHKSSPFMCQCVSATLLCVSCSGPQVRGQWMESVSKISLATVVYSIRMDHGRVRETQRERELSSSIHIHFDYYSDCAYKLVQSNAKVHLMFIYQFSAEITPTKADFVLHFSFSVWPATLDDRHYNIDHIPLQLYGPIIYGKQHNNFSIDGVFKLIHLIFSRPHFQPHQMCSRFFFFISFFPSSYSKSTTT